MTGLRRQRVAARKRVDPQVVVHRDRAGATHRGLAQHCVGRRQRQGLADFRRGDVRQAARRQRHVAARLQCLRRQVRAGIQIQGVSGLSRLEIDRRC